MKKTLFFFSLLLLLASAAQAQNGLSHKAAKQRHTAIRSGNKAMKKGHISNAISYYRQALVADSNSARAQFNLAYAYAKRNQADSALVCYKRVTENASATPDERARAHYNAGNICLRQALAARIGTGEMATVLHATRDYTRSGIIASAKGERVSRYGGSAWKAHQIELLLKGDPDAVVTDIKTAYEVEHTDKMR